MLAAASAAASPAPTALEEGWEPVANVCFRDPNAPRIGGDKEEIDEGCTNSQSPASSPCQEEFIPVPPPPPQFDNSPPPSMDEPANEQHREEKLIDLDEQISTLEREVLGEEVTKEGDEEQELLSKSAVVVNEHSDDGDIGDDAVKINLQYVYGEEGVAGENQQTHQQVPQEKPCRRGAADRTPTVKAASVGLTDAQLKENVIEAEIRAQQQRELELQIEQNKKKQILLLQQQEKLNQKNVHNSADVLRKKGTSSPHDSDEGFVDPPVQKGGKAVLTHTVAGSSGEPGIYDAVEAPAGGAARPAPVPVTRASTTLKASASPASPPPTGVSNTTENKIALEIRELKEREEELRRMRVARLAAKRVNENSGTNGVDLEEEFVEEDIEDGEDHGSSSSRDMLYDHMASLTTTTDEGNFSECGDATSSEDKSSNGSNSRLMSPEVPHTEYPRPPRRVTVRPYQDDEQDAPVYPRMKNESVIEREIRIAKERDEAFKKEKARLTKTSSVSNGLLRPTAYLPSVGSTQPGADSDTQHHQATCRIQMEIVENGHRERELMGVGKVPTPSEDVVDDKAPRISDIAEMPTEMRTKSPASRSSSTNSIRQTPNSSPHSTLSSSGRSSLNSNHSNGALSNGFSSGQFVGSSVSRLTRSLSTTNISSSSSPSSLTISGGNSGSIRPPKGLMEKFIASRGKMTPSAFSSTPLMGGPAGRVVVTRPMRVQPKTPVVLRQQPGDVSAAAIKKNISVTELTKVEGTKSHTAPPPYKRMIGAEEKIQEELREMQLREEELRQVRSRSLAQSQPNLLQMGLTDISFDEDGHNEHENAEEDTNGGVRDDSDTDDQSTIRSAASNPSLLDDGPDINKNARRRSTLIAEWELRIQATSAVDA